MYQIFHMYICGPTNIFQKYFTVNICTKYYVRQYEGCIKCHGVCQKFHLNISLHSPDEVLIVHGLE